MSHETVPDPRSTISRAAPPAPLPLPLSLLGDLDDELPVRRYRPHARARRRRDYSDELGLPLDRAKVRMLFSWAECAARWTAMALAKYYFVSPFLMLELLETE